MAKLTAPVRVEGIIRAILVLRGHRVLLDEMLSELYGVETKVLTRPLNATGPGFRLISCSSSPPPSGTV